MEDVLGGRTDPDRFAAFLADWEGVLARRTHEAVAVFAQVRGVRGLLLAGSVGRGAPWPLSDIDLIPIYDDDRFEEAGIEIERRRVEILRRWVREGWWTGLDIGKLAFRRGEVLQALESDGSGFPRFLRDDRWYHSLDKGYQSRAVYDPSGVATPLAGWLTAHRFDPAVVRFRLARAEREVGDASRRLRACLEAADPPEATRALRLAVKWLQTRLLEGWGERDNSLGRFGTRLERIATARGRAAEVDTLNALGDLDDLSVEQRMAAAPDWVWERHDRSWRARRHVGEALTRLQDARDVLRVCSYYELRRAAGPPFAAWLAIPAHVEPLRGKAARLSALAGTLTADPP